MKAKAVILQTARMTPSRGKNKEHLCGPVVNIISTLGFDPKAQRRQPIINNNYEDQFIKDLIFMAISSE